MGGGTFYKVGGGHKCTPKSYRKFFVVWIGNCDVTIIEIRRHYLYTIWRSKLYYIRQNYTTMKTYRWTTWNSKCYYRGDSRSTAWLGLSIRFIL